MCETVAVPALDRLPPPAPSWSWEALGQGSRGDLEEQSPLPGAAGPVTASLCVSTCVRTVLEALCLGEGRREPPVSVFCGPCCWSRGMDQVRHHSEAPWRGMAPAGRDDFSGESSERATSSGRRVVLSSVGAGLAPRVCAYMLLQRTDCQSSRGVAPHLVMPLVLVGG